MYDPVCIDKSEFANECLARAAGFSSECGFNVVRGGCFSRDFATCLPHVEVFSELGVCIAKPWDDFVSCAEEKRQGACSNGRDPNPWVVKHCAITCENATSDEHSSGPDN
jgi:hypothetical protein